MWQTKYASAVPKNLGFDFWPCSEGDFLTGRPLSVPLALTNALASGAPLGFRYPYLPTLMVKV